MYQEFRLLPRVAVVKPPETAAAVHPTMLQVERVHQDASGFIIKVSYEIRTN